MSPVTPLNAALVDEASRKSSVLWLSYAGTDRARPAWHTVVDGAVYLVAARRPESDEQLLPGLDTAREATVILRAKEGRSRLITWQAHVALIDPGTSEWDTATKALRADRLNAASVSTVLEDWSATAFVVRLDPTGAVLEHPGAMPTASGAAPPPDTPATTRGRLPWLLHRRARRSRRLT